MNKKQSGRWLIELQINRVDVDVDLLVECNNETLSDDSDGLGKIKFSENSPMGRVRERLIKKLESEGKLGLMRYIARSFKLMIRMSGLSKDIKSFELLSIFIFNPKNILFGLIQI